jgi:hypothetical protein
MKVAAPMAGGFIVYIAGLLATVFSFRKARQYFRQSKYALAFVLALSGLATGLFFVTNHDTRSYAATAVVSIESPNSPMGIAKGILPGRVVWVHNPDATNENCVPNSWGHAWFLTENMDQAVVDRMLSTALDSLTGQTSDSAAWSMIFQFHNLARGKGPVNYAQGEKIFIKINATSTWGSGGSGDNYNSTDLSARNSSYYGVSETSVASVLAVLRQLVNVVGVADTDIYVGDPLKHIYKHLYDVWHAEFPNVHYLDYSGHTNIGREKVVASTTSKITYSDKGAVMTSAVSDYLYTIFENAEYMINIPMMKGHQRGGVTMFAKNHLGSHTRTSASHLHEGLVRPGGIDSVARRSGYGLYRVQVDLMEHELLGGKNLIYIMDALWGADYELGKPVKWDMEPFNTDYTSSLFVSLDPVAIESVGYDFLRTEFTSSRGIDSSVQMGGVDDYLHQAADSLNWPAGIKYDPDNSGVHIASLGVHEHWNNATNKEYTRNLGTDDGIELLHIEQTFSEYVAENGNRPEHFKMFQNYPNPFNPVTTISYTLPVRSSVSLKIYDALGRDVVTLVNEEKSAGKYQVQFDAKNLSSGVYFYRLQVSQVSGTFSETKKLVLLK